MAIAPAAHFGQLLGPVVENGPRDGVIFQQNPDFLPPGRIGFGQLDAVTVIGGELRVLVGFQVQAVAAVDDDGRAARRDGLLESFEVPLPSQREEFLVEELERVVPT